MDIVAPQWEFGVCVRPLEVRGAYNYKQHIERSIASVKRTEIIDPQ